MAANKSTTKAASPTAETVDEDGVVTPGTAAFDTSGFVTSITNDGQDWGKISVDRKMYKPEYCAKFGGVQGYLLKVEQMQSDKIKGPNNPEGIFQALIMRLTAPAPVVGSDGDNPPIERAEIGEDVIVVVTNRLEKLVELDSDPNYCAEVQIVPTVKSKIGKKELWRYDVGIRMEKIDRKSVGAEALFFAATQENADKLIGAGAPQSVPNGKQAQNATA